MQLWFLFKFNIRLLHFFALRRKNFNFNKQPEALNKKINKTSNSSTVPPQTTVKMTMKPEM